MKKLKNCAGLTLIEMLATVMILALLILGINAGVGAAARSYTKSIFESNSGSLEGILNTAMGDVLRFSQDVHAVDGNAVFTSLDYGVRDAYLTITDSQGSDTGNYVVLKKLSDGTETVLVNTGAYPRLKIQNLRITCSPDTNYFDITYQIADIKNAELVRDVKHVVGLLNP